MAQLPVRSLRLQNKSADSLDKLNGNSGEIFYDSDNRTLRLYTGVGSDTVIFASVNYVDTAISNIPEADLTGLATELYVDTAVSNTAPIDNPRFTGLVTLQQSTEVLNAETDLVGTVIHDFSTGAIWYHSNILADFTANFINIPTTDSRSIVCTLILAQGEVAYIPNVVQIDDDAQTINWLGGTLPAGNANKVDVVSFTLIRINDTWTVLGSLTTYG